MRTLVRGAWPSPWRLLRTAVRAGLVSAVLPVLVAMIALAALLLPAQQAAARGDPPPAARGQIAEVAVADLPVEARRTLALIRKDGPFPYDRDGIVFNNREKLLPLRERGWYREYTVVTPGVRHRGARRIVAARSGEFYYTEDHYASFRRIRE
jgi:ribonuclease T1